LADAEGLETLSYRRLADRLGVTPMALYRHVGGRDALLDGIGDLVLDQLSLPESTEADWREQFRATARSFRALLIAHPAVVPIFLSRPLFTPAGMRAADALLGLFKRAGFSAEDAVLAYRQAVRILLALITLETESAPELSTHERAEQARVALMTFEALSPEQYPHLVDAAALLVAPYDQEHAFESGLDLLGTGLERLRSN
jgi:AcrR family transcriptional regulator